MSAKRLSHTERLSLRIAILATAVLYAALFAFIEPHAPLRPPARAGEADASRSGSTAAVTVVLEGIRPGADMSATVRTSPNAASSDSTAAAARSTGSPSVAIAHPAAPTTEPPALAQRSTTAPKSVAALSPALVPASVARASASQTSQSTPPASIAGDAASKEAAGSAAGEDVGASAADGIVSVPASRGVAGTSNAPASEMAAILALIRDRIERERSYPMAARMRGIEGTVTASVTVDGLGDLASERIVQSSGSAILDRAGIALLRRVFPVPDATGSSFTLEVRIDYRLVGESEAE